VTHLCHHVGVARAGGDEQAGGDVPELVSGVGDLALRLRRR